MRCILLASRLERRCNQCTDNNVSWLLARPIEVVDIVDLLTMGILG